MKDALTSKVNQACTGNKKCKCRDCVTRAREARQRRVAFSRQVKAGLDKALDNFAETFEATGDASAALQRFEAELDAYFKDPGGPVKSVTSRQRSRGFQNGR